MIVALQNLFNQTRQCKVFVPLVTLLIYFKEPLFKVFSKYMQDLNLQKKWLLLYVTIKASKIGYFHNSLMNVPLWVVLSRMDGIYVSILYKVWISVFIIMVPFQKLYSWVMIFSNHQSLIPLYILYATAILQFVPEQTFQLQTSKRGVMVNVNLTEWHKMVYLYSQPMQMDGNTNKQ